MSRVDGNIFSFNRAFDPEPFPIFNSVNPRKMCGFDSNKYGIKETPENILDISYSVSSFKTFWIHFEIRCFIQITPKHLK